MTGFRFILFALVFAALSLAGHARADEPLRVVASFSVLADIVAQVGGEDVAVTSLVPMGEDPHSWRSGPHDRATLAGAGLVVANGLGLEAWLDRLVANAGYRGPVLIASRGVEALPGPSGAPDPHAWHSLAAVRSYARDISVTLIGLRPDRAEALRARLRRFLAELDELDRWARGRLDAIPPEKRVIVTGHGGFAWLGRDFGIRVVSPPGLDSVTAPAAERMAELVAAVRAAGVRAVFLDGRSDPAIGHTLAEEAGVHVGAALFADTLTPECGLANDYLSLWRNNFALITETMNW